MKHNNLNTLAAVFALLSIGGILISWTAVQTVKSISYRDAYLLEKARAEAAEEVIYEIAADWDDFYDVYAEGDNYSDWQTAKRVAENYCK